MSFDEFSKSTKASCLNPHKIRYRYSATRESDREADLLAVENLAVAFSSSPRSMGVLWSIVSGA